MHVPQGSRQTVCPGAERLNVHVGDVSDAKSDFTTLHRTRGRLISRKREWATGRGN
jgi:hypothetical protein